MKNIRKQSSWIHNKGLSWPKQNRARQYLAHIIGSILDVSYRDDEEIEWYDADCQVVTVQADSLVSKVDLKAKVNVN